MSPSGPLAGRNIIVTRPREQAAALLEMIQAAGGQGLALPLLDIAPADDDAPIIQAAAQLEAYRLTIFVSPNAVRYALPHLLAGRAGWPVATLPAAVGPGTAVALANAGVPGCLLPPVRYDSEGLLALPAMAEANVTGCRVAIFRGNGGRELLADTLRARGATVDCITCYQRSAPAAGFSAWETAWQCQRIDAIVVSSSEALRYLVAGLASPWLARLQQTPVFVPHLRIAEQARSLGLCNVVQTAATDCGLIEGLLAYNWSA